MMAGDHAILSTSLYKHNGSNNSLTRDANLNHYKVNQVGRAFRKRKSVLFKLIPINKSNYYSLINHSLDQLQQQL